MKRSKRPLVILAIFHLLLILIYDGFWYQRRNIPKQEVELNGRITDFKLMQGKNGLEYNITVNNVDKPFKKLLLKLDESLMNRSEVLNTPFGLLGERLSFKGDFEEFQQKDLEGSFDIKAYYENEGYRGFVKVKALKLCPNDTFSRTLFFLPNFLLRFREKMVRNLKFILGETEAGTLSAMIFGDKSGLDREVKELYADNAISHVLAISGLHISIVGLLIFIFCKKIHLSYRLSAVIPIIFLVLYGLFTGFSVSTARAVIMMSLLFLSYFLKRAYDIPTALAFSSIILLLLNHRLLYQAGFQLSFLSVIGIFYGLKLVEKIFMREKRGESRLALLSNTILASILCTVTINLFILPVQLWHYFEVSLNGILLNIVVIPFMSILIIMGLLGSFLSLHSILLGIFFLGSSNFILKLYTFLCEVMEGNQWNKVILGRPGIQAILFYYTLLLLMLNILWKLDRKEKILKWKGFIEGEDIKEVKIIKKAFILIILLISICGLSYRKKETKVKTMEIGRGSCKVVQLKNGKAYLIDCGSKTVKNFVKYQLVPYLKYYGISKIEGVFLTDLIEEKGNGIVSLTDFEEIKIKQVYIPEEYKEKEGETALFNAILFHLKKRRVEPTFIRNGAELKDGNMTFILKKDDARGERRVLLKKDKE